VEDNAILRTVCAEKQPFKGVESYFTDTLLYQEANEVAKVPLLEDDDRAMKQIQSQRKTRQLFLLSNQL